MKTNPNNQLDKTIKRMNITPFSLEDYLAYIFCGTRPESAGDQREENN